MEMDKHFTITYYAKKHKKHISRQAKWDSLCRYFTSKSGVIVSLILILTQTIIGLRVAIIR